MPTMPSCSRLRGSTKSGDYSHFPPSPPIHTFSHPLLPFPPHRLNTAEDQLEQLRQENNRLRSTSSSSGAAPAAVSKRSVAVDDGTARDATWRLQQLQTQYDFLVSKTSSQGQSYKHMEAQIDDYAQKVRDLRRALEELRHEKDISDTKADRADELERAVSEMRSANRSLEDKIARLCEAPFIADAFGRSESRSRFEDAASEREENRSKIMHLQEAVRAHFSALTSLKQHANQLREEKEAAEKRAEELRLKYQELEMGSSENDKKLKLFSGDDGVDYKHLELALQTVVQRTKAMEKLPFLEDPDGDKVLTIPVMKRKLEEVQVMNLKLTEEVERFENMLKLQSGINRDLHKELEALVHKRDKDKRELQTRAEDFEELAKKRLNKIQSLEAQVRQLVYGMSKSPNRAPPAVKFDLQHDTATVISDGENVLLNELIEERGADLSPDENLLEVWVKGASISDNTLTPGSSSFIVVDFFDYESQSTSFLPSLKPQWDFAATYKITVDDFFLRYLATDVIVFELNMVSQGDFAMLARCTVPLSGLLKSKPMLRINNHPMISLGTGEITAYLTVEIRLAIPVSELYRLFLERHPTERKHIEEKSTRLILEATSALDRAQTAASRVPMSGTEDESRLYNELEISVLKAVGLPKNADGSAPTAYIHFQFLGHPDKYTNPVANSSDPSFNEKFPFAMVTNDQQLRLLKRSRLQLTVVDMKGEENDDPAEGLIGEVSISLGELAEGSPVMDLFSIKNADGQTVADLQISMRWKHPFRKQRELGPRALSGLEVEQLISAFSGDSEGTINYLEFCRFIDPPYEVRTVMDRVRAYIRRSSEKEHRTPRDIFTVLLGSVSNIDEDSFKDKMRLTNIDALPLDFSRLFQFVDLDEDNQITVDQLLAVLNLDEIVGVPLQLHEKLQERARDLDAKHVKTLRLFQDADQWGANGIVTRMEFKGVLKKMGFQLADEPDATELLESHIAKNAAMGGPHEKLDDDNDVLNDTMGSGDEVLLQNDPSAPERGRQSTNKKEVQEQAKKQRELFDSRSREALDQRQQAMLEAERAAGGRENQNPNAGTKAKVRSQTVEELAGDPYSAAEHRVAMSSNAGIAGKAKDATELDMHATKVQANIRGQQSRAEPAVVVNGLMLPSHESGDEGRSGPIDILGAEEAIRKSLRVLQGVHPDPNFLAGFRTVDTKGLGYVNRAQFAHVLKQFDVLQLTHAQLKSCMDFFDMSSDGLRIDYNAFVRLVRSREPDALPAVQKLQKMLLGPDAIYAMRTLDSNGSGYIKRADMMRVLADLGHGNIGNSMILNMVELFETKIEGQVNYSNFVEFVRENSACLELDAISARLYQIVIAQSGVLDDKSLRTWYKKIDVGGRGKFAVQEFSEFLIGQDLHVSKEVVAALFAVMEKGQGAVNFNDFSSWIRAAPTAGRSTGAAYTNLTTAELQKKANVYMMNVAKAGTVSGLTLEEIAAAYSIYDWRRPPSGSISKAAFIKATKRAGFVFTIGEFRMLTSPGGEFGDTAGNVAYRKFLDWATPDFDNKVSAGLVVSAPTGPSNTASALMRFLEKKLKTGTDLLSVFARYDSLGAGRITVDEFCAAIADLGLSTATHREALEAADRFKAATGNFVLYRRIVTELLKQIDEVTGAATIDVVETIRAAMQRSKVEVKRLRDLFEYYDRKGTGMVREEDLGTVFEEARIKLKRQEVDSVADRYANGGSGWVKYTSLLSTLESRMGEGPITSKPAALSEELCHRLRELLEALIIRGKDMRSEFDRFDDNFSGSCSQADFREVLQERLRAALPAKDIDALEKVYRDLNDPRRVSFVNFMHDMHPRRFAQRTSGLTGTVSSEEEQVWEIAESLRQKIRRRCDYAIAGELRRPYQHFARRKNESGVSFDDLALGIRELGMRVAGDQLKALFDLINLSGAKAFTYTDFVVFVRDPNHTDVVWKLKRLIARAKTSEKEVLHALQEQGGNSGLLTAAQFNKALNSCNIELSESDVARMVLRFDSEESQRIDLEKFVRFMRGQPTERAEDQDGDVRRSVADENVETVAWNALKVRVEDKLTAGFSPSEVFAYFDSDNRGSMDLISLQKGARDIGAVLSRPEARAVLRRMTTLAGGPVTKATFFEALQVNTIKSRGRDEDERERVRDRDRDSRERRGGGSDLDGIFDRLKDRLGSQKSLKAAFSEMAIERQGSVTIEELTSVFDRCDLRATRRDIRAIFDALDPTMSDFVKIDAILRSFNSTWTWDTGAADDRERGRDVSRSDSRSYKSAADAAAVFRRSPDLLTDILRNMAAIKKSDQTTLDDLKADLKKADNARVGDLEKGEFGRVLRKFGFKMREADERHLVDTLGEGRSGIDYNDFVDALRKELDRTESLHDGRRGDDRQEMREDDQLDDILGRLKRRISRDMKKGQSLADAFYAMDTDGDGELSIDEIERGLDKMGIPLSREESKRVVSKFGAGPRNTIAFKLFVKAMDPGLDKAELVDVMVDRIRRLLEDRLGSSSNVGSTMKRAFEDVDANGDGKLTESEFKRAMAEQRVRYFFF